MVQWVFLVLEEKGTEKKIKGDTGAKGADGLKGAKGDTGAKGSDANSIEIQAGTNITIDKTNPKRLVINASGGTSKGTDLSYKFAKDRYTIESSTGNPVDIHLANNGRAGVIEIRTRKTFWEYFIFSKRR
ncbi:hypothetical protein PL372_11940 [Tenacibaculum dicentrarchi]|nr:hypothetical protein [Tenacibaculum dicentrarchi]